MHGVSARSGVAMFPALDAILRPDRRHETMIFVDHMTGATRPMDITDLHRLVSPLQLGGFVPPEIREQFDKASKCLPLFLVCLRLGDARRTADLCRN